MICPHGEVQARNLCAGPLKKRKQRTLLPQRTGVAQINGATPQNLAWMTRTGAIRCLGFDCQRQRLFIQYTDDTGLDAVTNIYLSPGQAKTWRVSKRYSVEAQKGKSTYNKDSRLHLDGQNNATCELKSRTDMLKLNTQKNEQCKSSSPARTTIAGWNILSTLMENKYTYLHSKNIEKKYVRQRRYTGFSPVFRSSYR